MNPKFFNPDYLMSLCQKYGLRPSKKFGQNFLIDESPIEKMIEAAEISKEDTVVEVGPGFGVLTFALAERADRVMAFEIEKKLQGYWEKNKPENVEIVWGNVLRQLSFPRRRESAVTRSQIPAFAGMTNFRGNDSIMDGIASPPLGARNDRYKVVANLPYQITSNVIRKFLDSDNPPEVMVLMVQKEVAERICAKPGEMSLLAVAVQYYASTEIIARVSRASFWPEPAVDSAIVSLRPATGRGSNSITSCHSRESGNLFASPCCLDSRLRGNDNFFKVVRVGFSQRRKFLIKNLKPLVKKKSALKEIFKKIGLNEKIRAQELSIGQWKQIVENL